MKQIHSVKAFFLIAGAGILMLTIGCSPKIDNGGYVREGEIKDLIVVGQSTKDEVKSKLGSPSAQSSFGDDSWYYVTSRKETVAFLRPEIVDQNVARIEFNNAGIVSKIDTYTKNDSEDFAIAKRTTPTEGHTMGFFEQVLGNVGRFNAPGGDNSVAAGRKPGS